MVEFFKKSGKIGCFVAVRAPFNFHLAEFEEDGLVRRFRSKQGIGSLDQRWLFHLPQGNL
jgi:hypothetical protein